MGTLAITSNNSEGRMVDRVQAFKGGKWSVSIHCISLVQHRHENGFNNLFSTIHREAGFVEEANECIVHVWE